MRDLFDDDVVHEVREVVVVERAGLERAAVDDDACGQPGVGGEVSAERDPAALPWCGVGGWDVLDRELGALKLARPLLLESFDSAEHELVESSRARAVGGHGGGQQRSARSASASVAAPHGAGLGGLVGDGGAHLGTVTRRARASWPPGGGTVTL